MTQVYHGETHCQGTYKSGLPCRNNAYYKFEEAHLCGVHTMKVRDTRTTLLVNPNKEQIIQQLIDDEAEAVRIATQSNKEAGYRGQVICTKLKMYGKVERIEGFRRVHPNFKHQNWNGVFGCKSLSPKDMGPVIHNQPGLPIAFNLENFHQGNKVFPSEVDDGGDPTLEFRTTQAAMYANPTPIRHKPQAKGQNVPLYSVWKDKNGQEKRFTYIESRQFYCNYYERFALDSSDFRILCVMHDKGVNLQICGYDAYPVTKSLEEHYLDDSKPFGHEMVLYTMLTVNNPENYPWRKYKTEDF